jgi:hypothetical protein
MACVKYHLRGTTEMYGFLSVLCAILFVFFVNPLDCAVKVHKEHEENSTKTQRNT